MFVRDHETVIVSDVHVDDTNTFTTVIITVGDFQAIGTAKRNANDTPQAEIGFSLALARAFRELADWVEEGHSFLEFEGE